MNFFFFLILIILISQDFLLFNEESLILICFIGFCWICLDNLGHSITNYFYIQSTKITNDILLSYNNFLTVLKKQIQLNKKKRNLFTYFLKIKNYSLKFNYYTINKLEQLQINKKQVNFQNKLIFVYNLEKQFLKLITLLIITKIKRLVLLNKFYKNELKIKNFICINKICLYEYFKMVN